MVASDQGPVTYAQIQGGRIREVIFSADGIRGIAGEWPLIEEGAWTIGCALGQLVSQHDNPTVVMGRDTRPSGPMLAYNLKLGLLGRGVKVIDLGIMTTPGVAYIAKYQKAALGISVSASHSPVKYNGIKLVGVDGLRLTKEKEDRLKELINLACDDYKGASSTTSEQQTEISGLVEFYIDEQIKRCGIKSLKGRKFVLDCANGAVSRVAPQVLRGLDADVVAINTNVGEQNINDGCGSECARENPQSLIATVKQHGAAYGFAFDGDGDRLVIVDTYGNAYNGDDFLFALATHSKTRGLLRKNTIVTTDMANTGLKVALEKYGIRIALTKNGDRNLEQEIWAHDYYLGAEQVGNVIIHDGYHAAADSLYAALLIIRAILDQGVELNRIVDPFRKHPQVLATASIAGEPLWKDNEMPSRIEDVLRDQEQSSQVVLGQGSRIISWRSTTEPEHFNTMIEGGRHNTLEEVQKQATTICRAVQQAIGSDGEQLTVLDLSSRKRALIESSVS